MITKQEAKTIMLNNRAMSNVHDFYISSLLLELHQPKHIVELGTGTGGWISSITRLIDSDFHCTVFENYDWGQKGISWNGENYPKNLKELKKLIKGKAKHPNRFTFHEKIDPNVIQNYDTLRYDVSVDDEIIFTIINNSNDKSLIFVDDFAFNKAPERIYQILELERQGMLYPIWSGDKETAWTNNQNYRNNLVNSLSHGVENTKAVKYKNQLVLRSRQNASFLEKYWKK